MGSFVSQTKGSKPEGVIILFEMFKYVCVTCSGNTDMVLFSEVL